MSVKIKYYYIAITVINYITVTVILTAVLKASSFMIFAVIIFLPCAGKSEEWFQKNKTLGVG